MSEWSRMAAGVYGRTVGDLRLSVDRMGRDWYWSVGRKGAPSQRGSAETLAQAQAAADAAADVMAAG